MFCLSSSPASSSGGAQDLWSPVRQNLDRIGRQDELCEKLRQEAPKVVSALAVEIFTLVKASFEQAARPTIRGFDEQRPFTRIFNLDFVSASGAKEVKEILGEKIDGCETFQSVLNEFAPVKKDEAENCGRRDANKEPAREFFNPIINLFGREVQTEVSRVAEQGLASLIPTDASSGMQVTFRAEWFPVEPLEEQRSGSSWNPSSKGLDSLPHQLKVKMYFNEVPVRFLTSENPAQENEFFRESRRIQENRTQRIETQRKQWNWFKFTGFTLLALSVIIVIRKPAMNFFKARILSGSSV